MSKINEVKRLLKLTEKYGLEGCGILSKYTPAALAKIYNGIGPDSFPDWLRGCISALHPSLAVVAFVHDVEWHESDGSEEKFAESNTRFKTNGYKVAKAEYGWYNPLRYIVMNDARRFGNLCQLFGWDAWASSCQCDVSTKKCKSNNKGK